MYQRRNLFGTSDVGPDNPKCPYSTRDSYEPHSITMLDFVTPVHDKAYDKKQAQDIKGALYDVAGIELATVSSMYSRYNTLNFFQTIESVNGGLVSV